MPLRMRRAHGCLKGSPLKPAAISFSWGIITQNPPALKANFDVKNARHLRIKNAILSYLIKCGNFKTRNAAKLIWK